jgi:hypothetical protein
MVENAVAYYTKEIKLFNTRPSLKKERKNADDKRTNVLDRNLSYNGKMF